MWGLCDRLPGPVPLVPFGECSICRSSIRTNRKSPKVIIFLIPVTKNLQRFYGDGDLHFVTFSCYRRLPHLGGPKARNTFVNKLRSVCDAHHFLLVGYVVMPEHVHLLISETPDCTPSDAIQILKDQVAFDLNQNLAHLTPFWDRRFYDFNVYSVYKRREKLQYMHMNPIKRGLVRNPRFWPWSIFLNYEKGLPGLIPIDFV